MAVHYSGRAQILRYTCRTGVADARGTCRHALAGRVLDQLVADQVLAALRPGALELSLAAAEDVIRERSALDENWRQRLERARTQAARIERQYQAAEPENRLVQRTLERRWEEALQEVRRLEEEYARFRQTQPTALTRHEVDQIRELARDLPALWDAPTTTPADRQQIIRFLVERVEVAIEGVSDRVRVTITWAGGQQTRHERDPPGRAVRADRRFRPADGPHPGTPRRGADVRRDRRPAERGGISPAERAVRFHKDIVSRLVRRHTPGDRPPRKSDRCRVGSGRMVRDRPGRQAGDREEHAPRLAPAGLGPVPAVARVPGPVRVLGRCRGARTARSVGPDATGLVGPGTAVGVDHAEVAAGTSEPEGRPASLAGRLPLLPGCGQYRRTSA